MGIFDFFRKKPNQPEKAELDLEALLQKAAVDPGYRTEFYNRLLTDKLVIIIENGALAQGEHLLQKNTKVKIVSYPDGRIPVFTTAQRIFDGGVIKEEVNFLEMKGVDLFELAQGATLVLNPYSDYGKELHPDEIQKLINGTMLSNGSKTITIEKETPVQIGQPAKYPEDIVKSLVTLFSKRPNVRAAYLGWIFNPSSGESPHYIFGIDADGYIQKLTQEAGFTAQQFIGPGEFCDFIKIEGTTGLSDYFVNSTQPFYKK